MKYKTCVSIAENSPKKLCSVLRRALKESDFAELRLDFLNPSQVPEALDLAGRHLGRTVCTLRPESEGGRFSGTEKERRSILRLIASYDPFLIDVEFNAIKKDRALAAFIKKTGTDMLVSWHDFRRTPGIGVLQRRLAEMRRHSRYVKIVTSAKKIHDASYVLALYACAKDTSLVAFAMGDLGRISRILCLYMGSPFTYVSLGRPVAPGQFSLRQIKRII